MQPHTRLGAASAAGVVANIVTGQLTAVWDRRMDQYGGGAAALKAELEAYELRHPGPDFLDGPHYQPA